MTEDRHDKSSAGFVVEVSSRNSRESSRCATQLKARAVCSPVLQCLLFITSVLFVVRLGSPFFAVFAGQSRLYGL